VRIFSSTGVPGTATKTMSRREAAYHERLLMADSVEKLADGSFGDVFGGPRTITRWAIVDPGPL